MKRLTEGAIAHRRGKAGVWVVHPHERGAFICIHLIKRDGEMVGYKSISEDMGPVECDCPLEFLGMAPATNAAWRERVQAYHKARVASFSPGDAVTVYGKPYTIVEQFKRSWIIRDANGRKFKTTAENIRRVEVPHE